jgi:hypothetical protein
MADTKITALTALTAADPANDVIPIVDVSDTTMAASGTTKKISVNNILSSSPTASGALTVTGLVTAGSATITGAATVGTTLGVTGVSTLTGAVGVGATPIGKFDVYAAASDTNIFIRSDTDKSGQIVFRDNLNAGNSGKVRYDHLNERLSFAADGAENLYLLSTGDLSVTTGNVVMATSGRGIDFSATANSSGTMTSELLNDYEEGTWTPSFQNVTLGNGSVTGFYTKIGNIVSVMFKLTFGSTTSVTSSVLTISGLPFSIDTIAVGYVNLLRSGVGQYLGVVTRNSATVFDFRALTVSGSTVLSSILNATAPATWGTGDEFTSQVTYRAS